MSLKTNCRLFITNNCGSPLKGTVSFGVGAAPNPTPFPAAGKLAPGGVYELLLAGDKTISSINATVSYNGGDVNALPTMPSTSLGTLYAEVIHDGASPFQIIMVTPPTGATVAED